MGHLTIQKRIFGTSNDTSIGQDCRLIWFLQWCTGSWKRDEFIGHVSIRHELNAALEVQGGHIGYAIRPSKQQQGYGSRLLALALPEEQDRLASQGHC